MSSVEQTKRERQRKRRNNETQYEREQRQQEDRQRHQRYRMNESQEKKQRRQEEVRQRQQTHQMNESQEERQRRQEEDRQRQQTHRRQSRSTRNIGRSVEIGVQRSDSYLGPLEKICSHCGSIYFKNENKNKCCNSGNRLIPQTSDYPVELINLLRYNTTEGKEFRKNIRRYNGQLSMTSCGTKLDPITERSHGVYAYKIHGEMYHRLGSLLPIDGSEKQFMQLYFVDT